MQMVSLFRVCLMLLLLWPPMRLAADFSVVDDESSACEMFVVVSKREMVLRVFDWNGTMRLTLPIACGRGLGQKERVGDNRTPEGRFSVVGIEESSWWSHDFGDGKGEIEGAYGAFFIRLLTPPHRGIGIHGTHLPSSIGTRATEGCIRLRNEDLQRFMPYVYAGMRVYILPDSIVTKMQ